jgi:hypothetical protein
VAKIAATTGIAPQLLLGLDGDMWRALVKETDRRWTALEELAAITAELLSELLRVQLARGGAQPPKPLRVPRPGSSTPTRRAGLSGALEVAAFAGAMRGQVVGHG